MKLTAKQVAMVSELKKCYHNVTKACEVVGINRDTHYEWVSKSDIYKKECDSVRYGLVDRAEEILHSKFEDDTTALIFFLKCKGNYSEKQEDAPKQDITLKIV